MYFFENYVENEAGRLFSNLYLFSKKAQYEVKSSDMQLSLNIFRQPSTWHKIKTNCIKLKTIAPEIYSILIFWKRVWDQCLHHILCMIFLENFFSCYILLTDQISMSDRLYFSTYWAICVLKLFVNLAVTSQNLKLTLCFLSRCFTA